MPQQARHAMRRACDDALREGAVGESPRPALLVGLRRSGKTAALLRQVGRAPQGSLASDHPLLRKRSTNPIFHVT
jgi:hypothetical protein